MSIDASTSLNRADKYLSAQEVADYLGVHVATVRSWRDKGPCRIKVGQQIRFKESDVLAWLKTLVETPGA